MKIKFLKNAYGYKADQEIEVTADEAKQFGDAVVEVKAAEVDNVAIAADEYAAKVDAQIEEKVNASVAKALKKASAKPSIWVGEEGRKQDENRGFKSFGHFLNTVRDAGHDTRNNAEIKAAGLTGSIDADGGVALPPGFSNQLLQGVQNDPESLVARTLNINLSGEGRSMSFPSIKNYDQTSVDPTKVPVASWLDEADNKPLSRPAFEKIELKLKKVAAVIPTTDEMRDDVGALESILTKLGPIAINRAVNEAIVRGNGTSQPTGFLNHAATVSVARNGDEYGSYGEGSGVVEDIAEMYSRFSGNRSTAVWIYNPDILPELMLARVASAPVFLPPGGISSAPYDTIMGRPAIPSENAGNAGTKGDLMLVDLKEYLTLTKGGIVTDSSIHVYFLTDQTAYRFVYRIDGKPALTAPITPLHGTKTRSPFVVRA